MNKKQIFATINIISFLLLAFSVSYEFQVPAIQLTCLLVGLIGTIGSAIISVFNPKVWIASHGPKGTEYEGAFKFLVSVIFTLIIINAIFSITHFIPASLNILKLFTWIVGYSAMISPNLVYIFKKEKSESIV